MPSSASDLVVRICKATGLSYKEIGAHAGVSGRTVQRWVAGRSHPMGSDLHKLAAVVLPRDPALAARIAAASGTTLDALGLGVAPSTLLGAQTETVLFAAAEAMDVSPRAVRPALIAAFARAAELGASPADLARALAEKPKASKG